MGCDGCRIVQCGGNLGFIAGAVNQQDKSAMKFRIATIKRMYAAKESAIKNIYASRLPEVYDQKLSSTFEQWKALAINASNLHEGDAVIVFCCGTGNDFSHLLERIGETGRILGVDFSPQMLSLAGQKIQQEGWRNVELLEADVTTVENKGAASFDAGICTLGMSIIPDYKKAYGNLLSHVRSGGEIIIGDLQLAASWRVILNPRIVYGAKEFGGSYRGHRNSRKLFSLMERQLSNVRRQSFHDGAYSYCIGRKGPSRSRLEPSMAVKETSRDYQRT